MQRYDHSSGLMYRESIIRIPPSQRSMKLPPPSLRLPGVDRTSLRAACLRVLVRNVTALTAEALRVAPGIVARQIWLAVRENHLETEETWKTFVKSGHGEQGVNFSIDQTWSKLRSIHAVDYFLSIASSDYQWLTHLTFDNPPYTALEFSQIAKIVNLKTLRVRYSSATKSSVFNDEVIIDLSLKAKYLAALASLELILICNSHVTPTVFQYLSSFPSIKEFVCSGTSIQPKHDSVARLHGWSLSEGGKFAGGMSNRHIRYDDDDEEPHPRDIERPVRQESPTPSPDVAALPELFVDIHEPRARYMGTCPIYERLDHYRRLIGPFKPAEVWSAPAPAPVREPASSDVRPAGKKRKLRDGKALELNDSFQFLVNGQ